MVMVMVLGGFFRKEMILILIATMRMMIDRAPRSYSIDH
jgi:hypothetical protein